MVQESQSPTFSAQRPFAVSSKPNRVVVGVGMVLRHHAERLVNAVVVNRFYVNGAYVLYVAVVFDFQRTDPFPDLEQPAGEQPLTQIVVVRQPTERLCRYGRNDMFKAFEVVGACYLLTGLRVYGHKVAEAELPPDVFTQLLGQGLRLFHNEPHPQLLGDGAHRLLRRLQQERHGGIVLAYEPAEVNPRI